MGTGPMQQALDFALQALAIICIVIALLAVFLFGLWVGGYIR